MPKESIDQNRFFNTALTPLEVEALYTEELCICDGTVDTLDILEDGSCIATYQLDGNANDLSGNYSGEPTDVSYGVGEFDLAGVFNGSSSYIDTNYSLPASSNFSFSFWFTVGTTSTKFLAGQTGGSSNYFHIASVGTILEIQIGTVNYVHLTVPNMADGNWHHLVISRNAGSGYTAYLDNSNVGTFSNTVALGSANFFLGARDASHSSSLRLLGSIDQVRIFNKALSAGEVTTLYDETACTHIPSACVDVFGDDSGIALYDLNGDAFDTDKKYNGQIIGSPTLITGKFGDAYSCTNTDYIQTPQYVFSNSYTDGISVSLWAKFNSANYQTPIGIYVSSDPLSSGFKFRTSTGGNGANWSFSKANGASIFTASSGELSVTLNDGNWHHIVMTWTGDTSANGFKLYVDNNLLDQRTASETIASQQFVLGQYFGTDLQSANRFCSVDQIRFFKKDLSSAEVTTLYTSDASCG